MNDEQPLSLANLGGGGAVERFEDELQAVLENILDRNTKATAKRKIVMEVTFCPDESRSVIHHEVKIISKPAPMTSTVGLLYLARRGGKPVAVVHDQEQLQMDFDEQDRPRKVEGASA